MSQYIELGTWVEFYLINSDVILCWAPLIELHQENTEDGPRYVPTRQLSCHMVIHDKVRGIGTFLREYDEVIGKIQIACPGGRNIKLTGTTFKQVVPSEHSLMSSEPSPTQIWTYYEKAVTYQHHE